MTLCFTSNVLKVARCEVNCSDDYEQRFKVNFKHCKTAMVVGEKHQDIHLLAVAYSAAAEFTEDRYR